MVRYWASSTLQDHPPTPLTGRHEAGPSPPVTELTLTLLFMGHGFPITSTACLASVPCSRPPPCLLPTPCSSTLSLSRPVRLIVFVGVVFRSLTNVLAFGLEMRCFRAGGGECLSFLSEKWSW